jgi:ATP-binding cassette subfamily F protein 3
LERIVPAHVDSPFEFRIRGSAEDAAPLVTVEEASCGYTNARIVDGINISIGPWTASLYSAPTARANRP